MTDTSTPLSTADFDYYLPDALIARYPLDVRSASRLLHVQGDVITDRNFVDLPSLLDVGDLLVLNDTKVMKARLYGVKDTGGAVEVLIERISDHERYIAICHVRASKALKVGQKVILADGHMIATMRGRDENLFILQFDAPILADLERYGQMPIPPYFRRQSDSMDDTRYQTIFYDSNKNASVAAPTASLHFDEQILQALADKGVDIAFVTLHVGAGTFAPVKVDDISRHTMHAEYAHLPQITADKINATKARGGRIIAVGTTVTRTLETAYLYRVDDKLTEFQGDTQIFIYPPYEFGVVDRLITNFHLPKSTLLMLVCAFVGTDNIKRAYDYAIAQQYRFFSYGDAMLLEKA